MKKFLSEFKKFALRGNVIDLAIGVIIGGAFQAIVSSLVGDIVSPLLGLIAKEDFSSWVWTIGGVEIKYGSFLPAVINFILMALVIFLFLRGLNKLLSLGKKAEAPEAPKAPTTKICAFCKSEIAIDATRCPHCTSVLEEAETNC